MTAEVSVAPVHPHTSEVGGGEPEIVYHRQEGAITPLMNACQLAKENQVRQILHRAVSL